MARELLHRIGRALRELGGELRSLESAALIVVTLVLVTRHSLGTPAGARLLAPLWAALSRWSPAFEHGVARNQLIAIVLQLVVPLVVILALHREKLKELGLGWGDRRFWLPITAAIFVVQILVIALYLSGDPVYARRYPSLPLARQGGAAFWLWEGSRLLYMLSWEFLFRGYLLFALARRIGLLACAVQTVPFTLMHIISHKPVSEVYFTILSGLLSGVFALEARSVWPIVWLHGVGAVLLDVFIVYK